MVLQFLREDQRLRITLRSNVLEDVRYSFEVRGVNTTGTTDEPFPLFLPSFHIDTGEPLPCNDSVKVLSTSLLPFLHENPSHRVLAVPLLVQG